jgi:uncharacterized protein YcnI
MSETTSRRRRRGARIVAAVAVAVVTLLASASPAGAHVDPDPTEVPAGVATTVSFSVGHGCEGSPTTAMDFQVPAGVADAEPVTPAGWEAEVADGVVSFVATSGNELADGVRMGFGIAFTAPSSAGPMFWKVIQVCETGELAWIEEWDGTGAEPEHPAPTVQVVGSAPTTTVAPTTTAAPTTTVAEPSTTAAAETTTSVEATTTSVDGSEAADDGDDDDADDDGGGIGGAVIGALVAAAVALGAGLWFWRRRAAG